MTNRIDSADGPGRGLDLATLDRTDRILLAGCATVWLAALGAGVAATVALVDLAGGQTESGDSGTPWFLYAVIGVSAAVIIAAVPLLLRARRSTQERSEESAPQPDSAESAPTGPAEPQEPPRGPDAPTEKFRAAAPGTTAEASGPLPRLLRSAPQPDVSPAVDQTFLRFGVAMFCAMGVATLLTGVATYLMAVHTEVAAWVLYGLAGVVTVGMGGIVWYFLRDLGASAAHDED